MPENDERLRPESFKRTCQFTLTRFVSLHLHSYSKAKLSSDSRNVG